MKCRMDAACSPTVRKHNGLSYLKRIRHALSPPALFWVFFHSLRPFLNVLFDDPFLFLYHVAGRPLSLASSK